jgi:hypothetical protein
MNVQSTPIRSLLCLVPLVSLALACGDYSGGASSGTAQTIVVGAAGAPGSTSAAQVAAFTATVNPLLQQHCRSCHAGSGPGTPAIAHPDPATAFSSLVNNQKVNFTIPSSSRIVRRLATDFHYCWVLPAVPDSKRSRDVIICSCRTTAPGRIGRSSFVS